MIIIDSPALEVDCNKCMCIECNKSINFVVIIIIKLFRPPYNICPEICNNCIPLENVIVVMLLVSVLRDHVDRGSNFRVDGHAFPFLLWPG